MTSRGESRSNSLVSSWYDRHSTARRRPAPTLGGVLNQTFGELAHLAIDGGSKQRPAANDKTFIQSLANVFTRTVTPAKLDTVGFTFSDRVAAWLSGFGKELRQLKEMQLESPMDPDGHTPTTSRLTKIQRRSLVLVGAEDTLIRRANGAIADSELRLLSGPGLVRKMSELLLKAHYQAVVFGESNSKASAQEVEHTFTAIGQDHSLSFVERVYLWLSGEFSEEEKEVLLARTTGGIRSAEAGNAPPAPLPSTSTPISASDLRAERIIIDDSSRLSSITGALEIPLVHSPGTRRPSAVSTSI